MTTVIVGMFVALLLAVGVVALVAIPARREGRELLTPQGEQLVQTARVQSGQLVHSARERVLDLAERLPTSSRDSSAESPDGQAMDPGPSDPQAMDPARSDPRAMDPASPDPQAMDPGPSDPQAMDPGPSDPQAMDPASPERVDLRPARSSAGRRTD